MTGYGIQVWNMTFFELIRQCFLWDADETAAPRNMPDAVIRRMGGFETAGNERNHQSAPERQERGPPD